MTLLMPIWMYWEVIGIGALILISALCLKLMTRRAELMSQKVVALLGGKTEVIRKSRQICAFGIVVVMSMGTDLLLYYLPTLRRPIFHHPLLALDVIVVGWMIWRIYRFLPKRKDPFDLGNWAGHEIDKPTHGKS